MKTIYKNNSGQSLIEVIIAVFILSTAITAVLALVTQNFIAAKPSKLKTQASFLAQEAVEIVNNIRDKNWNEGATWDNNFYDPAVGKQDGWYKLNAFSSTNGWTLIWKSATEASDDTSPALSLDNVTFTRYIKVAKFESSNDKRQIDVKVTWVEDGRNTQIETTNILTNWK